MLNADEITESSLKLGWRFVSSAKSDYAGGTKQQSDPVDGYVLTYSRLAPQRRPKPAGPESAAPASNKMSYLTEAAQSPASSRTPDPAARISQANPMSEPTSDTSGAVLDQWQAIQLAPQQRSHQLKNLECGSAYALKIWAFNKVGRGEPSDMLTISTRGKCKYQVGSQQKAVSIQRTI